MTPRFRWPRRNRNVITAPIPQDEEERLEALRKSGLLDTAPEEQFERITRIATKVFKVPISTLTLIDVEREWFKSCQGLDAQDGARAVSFCGHALLAEDALVVPDATKDARFADNPMVVGEPYIRFYAGVPVPDAFGKRLGVFCIKDRVPREFSAEDLRILKALAAWASHEVRIYRIQEELMEHEAVKRLIEDEIRSARDINRMVAGREVEMLKLKRRIKELEGRVVEKRGKLDAS